MSDPIILTREQIRDGYEKTVASALHLLEASMSLVSRYPAPALGLAELGQEELGKSLSLLAAYHFSWSTPNWHWLWDSWRNHDVKAHRAFLYELISPTRIETHDLDGRRLAAGLPVRQRLPHEKEAAFYVNFVETEGAFHAPFHAVEALEAHNRCFTLFYLAITADATRKALTVEDAEFRLTAFSQLSYRLCTEDLYQQDMPFVLFQFRQLSSNHENLVATLERALAEGAAFLHSCLPQRPSGA